MRLSREAILKRLQEHHGSPDDARLLSEVAYNLTLAATTEENLEERAARALQKLRRDGFNPSAPLTQAASTGAASKLSTCPICKMSMQPVNLIENRPVYYCQDHKISVPLPVERPDAAQGPGGQDDEADL